MSTDANTLRELYLDVTGGETVTERQQEEVSRDPIEERDAALERETIDAVLRDGLDDAVEGAEG